MVIRDDALPYSKTYKSKLYHIYNEREVRDDLNRKAEEHEPLSTLVMNAYYLLGRTGWPGPRSGPKRAPTSHRS